MTERFTFTEEITEDIISSYKANPTRETVQALATKYGRSLRSIVGKLSREHAYQKQEYKTKTGTKPVKKEELVRLIEKLCEVADTSFEGLETAPKHVLFTLFYNLGGGDSML